jgi:hypothetical protein
MVDVRLAMAGDPAIVQQLDGMAVQVLLEPGRGASFAAGARVIAETQSTSSWYYALPARGGPDP